MTATLPAPRTGLTGPRTDAALMWGDWILHRAGPADPELDADDQQAIRAALDWVRHAPPGVEAYTIPGQSVTTTDQGDVFAAVEVRP